MKALLLKKGKLRLEDMPMPIPSKGEAMIKVVKAGICNTDIEMLKGYMAFEGVLGHEFVGQVVKAADRRWRGRRIAGEINIACGKCEFCLGGNEKHCSSRQVFGIREKNGAFAQYLTLPVENLHLIPQTVSNQEAVFVEPLAAALEILEQVEISDNDSILVLGDGKLGLLVAQVMKTKTDRVVCLGRHKRKLEILKKKKIKTYLKGSKIEDSFDIVIEATGHKRGIEHALSRVKPKGKVILKSTYHQQASIDISKIVVDEIQIIGSRCGPFPKAIDLLKRGLVDVLDMVDGDFPLDEAMEAFRLAREPATMKVLITP